MSQGLRLGARNKLGSLGGVVKLNQGSDELGALRHGKASFRGHGKLVMVGLQTRGPFLRRQVLMTMDVSFLAQAASRVWSHGSVSQAG
jgi:hypothetical protein